MQEEERQQHVAYANAVRRKVRDAAASRHQQIKHNGDPEQRRDPEEAPEIKRAGGVEIDPVAKRQHHRIAADDEEELDAEPAELLGKPGQAGNDAGGFFLAVHQHDQQDGDPAQKIQRLVAPCHGLPAVRT